MKILALIPARSGSKRLPRKNILPLGGKPLVVWSIDAAKDIPEICDILVSTDDSEIAAICKKAEALVPWLRPKELATDTTSSVEVAIHALDWYEKVKEKVDGILLLQPTSPFRDQKTIKKAISLFINNTSLPVVTVSSTHAHPLWSFKIENGYCIPYFKEHALNTCSQNLTPAYIPNGSIYLCSTHQLREFRSFVINRNIPLLINSKKYSLDIDLESDISLAEYFLECSVYNNLNK